MTATQRYELIHPIVQQEKTVHQVCIETGVPASTLSSAGREWADRKPG